MLGVDAASVLVRRLPIRSAARLMSGLGALAGGLFRVRRKTVDLNLRIAFPEASHAERQQLAVASYKHLAAQASILFKMLVDDDALDTVVGRVVLADDETPEIVQWLQERVRGGRGTLILEGHFGNWEIAAGALARLGVPISAVATTQSNAQFDERIKRLRSRLKLDIIPRRDAKVDVPRALSAGKTVLLVADQFTRDGIPVHFFGSPILGARGPAVFARRAKVPVLFLAAVADPKDPATHSMHLAHVEQNPATSGTEATRELTQTYFDHLERAIRLHPAQYLWHHRRWRPLEGRVVDEAFERLMAGG